MNKEKKANDLIRDLEMALLFVAFSVFPLLVMLYDINIIKDQNVVEYAYKLFTLLFLFFISLKLSKISHEK
jgi:hypothetical protein